MTKLKKSIVLVMNILAYLKSLNCYHFTIILCFLLTNSLKAQLYSDKVYSVRKDVAIINNEIDTLCKVFKINIDSIEIIANCYEDKYITNNLFVNCKTNLEIDYYLKDNKLILIKITEESTKYEKLGKKFTEFYFENNENFDTLNYYLRPTGLAWKIEDDIDIIFGYNKSFDIVFLKEYSNNLFIIISKMNDD